MFFLIFYDPEQVERSRSEKWKNEQIIRRATIRAPLAERVDTQKPKKKKQKNRKNRKKRERKRSAVNFMGAPFSNSFSGVLYAHILCLFVCPTLLSFHLLRLF